MEKKEFVYLKLNDNYSNHFLTTNHGEIFYRDWLEQNRPEYVAVPKEKYDTSYELRELVRTRILFIKMEPDNKKAPEDNKSVEDTAKD